MSTFGRYILYQIPGWLIAAGLLCAVHAWFGVAWWLCGLIFGAYAAKDFILYPWLRRAYEGPRSATEPLIGRTASAVQAVAPVGYVRVDAELWKAELAPGAGQVEAGATAIIEAARGLTLIVRPE